MDADCGCCDTGIAPGKNGALRCMLSTAQPSQTQSSLHFNCEHNTLTNEPSPRPAESAKRFTAVYHARSTVLLPADQPVALVLPHPGTGLPVVASIRTIYEDRGFETGIPTFLEITMTGEDISAMDFMRNCGIIPTHLAVMLSVMANAPVGIPMAVLAFDCTIGSNRHEMYEFVPADLNAINVVGGIFRTIQPDDFLAFVDASHRAANESWTIGNAISHFEVALRYFNPSSLVLCVEHLYMACEALAEHFIEKATGGKKQEKLAFATTFGIHEAKTSSTFHRRLKSAVLTNLVFDGDNGFRDRVGGVSEGLEHGFGRLATIHTEAPQIAKRLLDLVQQKIVAELDVSAGIAQTLLAFSPIDWLGSPIYARTILEGEMTPEMGLAAEGQAHPRLRPRFPLISLPEVEGHREMILDLSTDELLADGVIVGEVHFGSLHGLNDPAAVLFSGD